MADTFKQGDIVQLKSGGPPMTVNALPDHTKTQEHYSCIWFKGASKESGYFAEHTLKAYEAPKK